jgi:hypothetical protein
VAVASRGEEWRNEESCQARCTDIEIASGTNASGRAIDLISVTPPFLSAGIGASYSLMTTWTFTQQLWSQKALPQ